MWRIELFGGLRARSAERSILRFQTQKTALLLAYLAYYPQTLHSREFLTDLLWPDAESDAGRNRLSQAVGWLRAQMEPEGVARGSILTTDRHRIGLNPDAVATDVAEFRKLLEDAATDPEEEIRPAQRRALEAAAALARGELLAGLYDDWVLEERQRQLTSLLLALRRLAGASERERDWNRALDYTRRALSLDPTAEELHCDLMRLLAASGQPAMALRQYRELERLLDREFGIAPSATAREMMQRIQDGETERAPVSGVAPGLAAALPAQLTKFFGREEQLRQVEALMEDGQTRLITFVGAGGAGKTRLAIEAAARIRSVPRDSLWLVPLADLSDGRLASRLLADILRLPQARQTSPLDSISAALSGRQALIVFDNAEHIVESVSEIVRQLIDRLPLLRVWVTSRQRLNLGGEREIAVPPLPVPSGAPPAAEAEDLMSIDGVRLFVDRAQAVRPAFAVTPQNAAAIAQVCGRLEGIPLALELCAAWAQTLTPEQMLTQLNHRFELLVSRRTDIATRHRSLRAAIEYSYLQLPSELQQLFVRLSVFRGGWTLAAAATVCPDAPAAAPAIGMLASITELRERSLAVAEEIGGGLEMRYRMLETLREFAAEQRTLALETSLRRRHAAYFLDAAEGAQTPMSGPDQAAWLTRIEADHDNMRAALAWALEKAPQDAEAIRMGLRLATALAPFWEVRGYYGEGHEWIERLLALSEIPASRTDTEVLAKAHNALAYMARGRSEFLVSENAAQTGLALARSIGEKQIMAASLQILGTLAYSRDDYSGARVYLEESLALSREIGKPSLIAGALLDLGNVAMEERAWQQAWDLYSESLELRRAEGNPKRNADALNNLGLVARYRGDLATAIRLMEESLANCRAISDRSGTSITLLNLGTVHRLSGRFANARTVLEEATAMCYDVDNRRALAWCVKEIGHLLCAEGDYRQGLELLSASESLRLALGITFHPADPEALSQEVLNARAALTEEELSTAWSVGSRLTFKQAYAKAMSLVASA